MKRTTRKFGKKAPVKFVQRDDQMGLSACFAEQDQLLLPMLELIGTGKQTITPVMNVAGRAVPELPLKIAAGGASGRGSESAGRSVANLHGQSAETHAAGRAPTLSGITMVRYDA